LVQPRFEGGLLVAMTIVATSAAFGSRPPFDVLEAGATTVAGALASARLL